MIALLLVVGEHLSRYRDVPLTSKMMRNVYIKVNNYICFTLSCELVGWPTIAKYQALEIFYRAHAGDVGGVVGEGEIVSWGVVQTKGEVHKPELTNKKFLHSDYLTSLSSYLKPTFLIGKFALRTNEREK